MINTNEPRSFGVIEEISTPGKEDRPRQEKIDGRPYIDIDLHQLWGNTVALVG